MHHFFQSNSTFDRYVSNLSTATNKDQGANLKHEQNGHTNLYGEVQEAFVNNLAKALRVAGGLSESGEIKHLQKSELAHLSGLSKGTVTKLTTTTECEEAKPDLETMCKLAYALNVSPAFLLMTERDWSFLLQAVGTLEMFANPEGEREKPLIAILEDAAGKQQVDEAIRAGLTWIQTLHSDDYSVPDRLRQQKAILIMTAVAQNAFRRQGLGKKMKATALGALLGDREIN